MRGLNGANIRAKMGVNSVCVCVCVDMLGCDACCTQYLVEKGAWIRLVHACLLLSLVLNFSSTIHSFPNPNPNPSESNESSRVSRVESMKSHLLCALHIKFKDAKKKVDVSKQ